MAIQVVAGVLKLFGNRQLDEDQRASAIKTMLDIVDRIRQEVAKVGFWKTLIAANCSQSKSYVILMLPEYARQAKRVT